MRKLILSQVFISLFFITKAQVLVNLQLPQAGLQVKSQLWNMSLVNTSSEVLYIKLDMTLTDVTTGQTVLSGSSRIFTLPSGAKQLQISDLVPIQYNVLNSTYNINNNPNGFLPVGTFNACFSILKRNSKTLDKIAEDCETIEVEPASPPFLSMPDDGAAIDQSSPLFTWLPPSPVYLFSNLKYDLKLVEVNNNQNPADAIQTNFPLLGQSNISNNTFQYPISLRPLDTAKLYAWQVKALNNMQAISNSEIFTFKVKQQQDAVINETDVYVRLKGLDEMPFTVCRGILKYEYVNIYNNAFLQLALTDVTTKANKGVALTAEQQVLTYGQNFLRLNLSANNSMTNNHIYELVVSGAKGEKQAVKFIYKNEN
jgi:hypothetical protein